MTIANKKLTVPGQQPLYWIAYSPTQHDIVHYGQVDPGQEVVTGQDNLKEYKTERGWKAALKKLNIDPDADEEANG